MNENLAPANHGEATHKEIILAAARAMCDVALSLIEADPHSYGTRPCQTCASVSALVGRPFGCVKHAIIRNKQS